MKNKRNAPRGIFLLTPAERRLVELATELPQWRWVKPFLPKTSVRAGPSSSAFAGCSSVRWRVGKSRARAAHPLRRAAGDQ